MNLDKETFEAWMERMAEQLHLANSKLDKILKPKKNFEFEGEVLLDNQDLCLMLKVSKRTLQRYRSSGRLPYHQIHQKTYYKESDVHMFIRRCFDETENVLEE